jgi:hypothetical protein
LAIGAKVFLPAVLIATEQPNHGYKRSLFAL